MEYWDFLYWRVEVSTEDFENYFTQPTRDEIVPRVSSIGANRFMNTCPIPWKSSSPEYRSIKGTFYPQPDDVFHDVASPPGSAPCEAAHPTTPRSGIPSASTNPASFHSQLVAQLRKKVRHCSSPTTMGNRGSSSNAPSPDKKPSSAGQSGKSSKEQPKSAKTEIKNGKGAKVQVLREKPPSRSPPKGVDIHRGYMSIGVSRLAMKDQNIVDIIHGGDVNYDQQS